MLKPLSITRSMRINQIAGEMITVLQNNAEQFRKMLTEGTKLKPGDPNYNGTEEFVCTGKEVQDAMGEAYETFKAVLEIVLEGKPIEPPKTE